MDKPTTEDLDILQFGKVLHRRPRRAHVDVLTKRLISHDEARAALQRFVHSHFRDGREVARIGIPARPDYDDDLVLAAYIEQRRAVDNSD